MSVQEIRNLINDKIASLAFGSEPKELYDPIHYIMQIGGKRMRPLLTWLGFSLFKKDAQKVLMPAIGIEVFHNFTLVHDDMMDQADLRRGKPTVHKKWNANRALLSGDVMLIRAYDYMMQLDNPSQLPRVLETFSRTAAVVCEGQQLDMNYEQLPCISETEYLEMIRRKTAVLLGFSLELGGIIAETSEGNIKLLREFGENIGLGFQLKDDWLDVYGDPSKFGKTVGGDIIANKKTFLLTKALELAKGEDQQEINHWLEKDQANREEKVRAVTALYNRLGVKELSQEKMNYYFDLGFEKLQAIRADETAKEMLRSFTEQLINREK